MGSYEKYMNHAVYSVVKNGLIIPQGQSCFPVLCLVSHGKYFRVGDSLCGKPSFSQEMCASLYFPVKRVWPHELEASPAASSFIYHQVTESWNGVEITIGQRYTITMQTYLRGGSILSEVIKTKNVGRVDWSLTSFVER